MPEHDVQTTPPPEAEGGGIPRTALPMALPLYAAPTLIRVRVETAQMISGKQTRDLHCTRHWHDDATTCANPD